MARAGRFGTKGLAVTFVSDETDAKILNDVQDRFEVNVAELPEEIDISTYSKLVHSFLVLVFASSVTQTVRLSVCVLLYPGVGAVGVLDPI